MVDLTIIAPVFNEVDNVAPLYKKLQESLSRLGRSYEIIMVDDGSTDGTWEKLRELAGSGRDLRLIRLRRNFGQTAAMSAGIDHARGVIIITMDADLQNDPRDIPALLGPLQRGVADMVDGYRTVRHDRLVRRASSHIGNGFRNWVLREQVRDVGCSLRAVRASCVRELPYFRGMHRFLPKLVGLRGGRILEVPVRHRPRRYGRAKYGIGNRIWVGMIDTLGVRWLAARHQVPVIECASIEAAEPGERSGDAAVSG